jgi:hypothetical protein
MFEPETFDDADPVTVNDSPTVAPAAGEAIATVGAAFASVTVIVRVLSRPRSSVTAADSVSGPFA